MPVLFALFGVLLVLATFLSLMNRREKAIRRNPLRRNERAWSARSHRHSPRL